LYECASNREGQRLVFKKFLCSLFASSAIFYAESVPFIRLLLHLHLIPIPIPSPILVLIPYRAFASHPTPPFLYYTITIPLIHTFYHPFQYARRRIPSQSHSHSLYPSPILPPRLYISSIYRTHSHSHSLLLHFPTSLPSLIPYPAYTHNTTSLTINNILTLRFYVNSFHTSPSYTPNPSLPIPFYFTLHPIH